MASGKVAISGASNGGQYSCPVIIIGFGWQYPKIGLLVCGSLVRAPEGTFGAAVPEGSVTDLLKVIKLKYL